MWRRRSGRAGVVAAVVLALAAPGAVASAWAADEPPVEVRVGAEAFSAPVPLGPRPLVSSDEALAQSLTRLGIGWFAGLYLDDGQPVLRTTRPDLDEPEATRAVRAVVEAGALSAREEFSHVRVEPATYSFGALHAWEKPLDQAFLAMDGAVFTDLDEQTDHIVLAYDPQRLPRRDVEALVERSDAPRDAVEILEHSPIVETSLRDRWGAAYGGIQVYNATTFDYCTLGFGASRDGVDGFVTADHCTSASGRVDGDPFYQPSYSAAWYVGRESVDRPAFTGDPCPPTRTCKYSDAVFVASPPGAGSGYGWVAHMTAPDDFTAFDGTVGAIVGDGNDLVGTAVAKIGSTTGKTRGTISRTCINTAGADNLVRLCQDSASVRAAAGDSGGPVVHDAGWPSKNTYLHGIVSGISEGEIYYSPIFGIQGELGPLSYLAPAGGTASGSAGR